MIITAGRVISAADWLAWGLEFESSRSQNFFFSEELRVWNNTLPLLWN